MKRFWMLGALILMLGKPAMSQMAVQIAPEDATKMETTVSVQTNGGATIVINAKNESGKPTTLESSVMRPDGSLESESDFFYRDNVLLGTMNSRFDTQSRFIEYSMLDGKGQITSTTRVFRASGASKVARTWVSWVIENRSPDGKTKISYSLSPSGRVTRKERNFPQQNANVTALYNARGVRRQMVALRNNVTTNFLLSFNEKNQLVAANISSKGEQKGQMTFAYNSKGRLSEMKAEFGQDTLRTTATYTQSGKPLESLTHKNGKLQLRVSNTYDSQDRPSVMEMHDSTDRLIVQTLTSYDAGGKASSRTIAFNSDGTQVVMPTVAK